MTKIKDMFLTLDEAADILRTNRRHIKRMVEAGILRAKNIGIGEERSFLRILKEDVTSVKNGNFTKK
ncbi:MAG: helix-turn-helix domain-containing protein [Saprospiraceae bacterium]|nr:helix-turn-helix domain-containing protein [Saprospiraceae bacterium]